MISAEVAGVARLRGIEGVIVFLGNAQINGSCLNSIISNGRSVRLLRVIQKNALVLGTGFFRTDFA